MFSYFKMYSETRIAIDIAHSLAKDLRFTSPLALLLFNSSCVNAFFNKLVPLSFLWYMPSFHCKLLPIYVFALHSNRVLQMKELGLVQRRMTKYAIPMSPVHNAIFQAHLYIFVGAYNHVLYNHYLNMPLVTQSLVQIQILKEKNWR